VPTTPLTVHQVLTDQSVDMALTLTAQMFGLSKATVTQIVQVGLPLIAHMTRTNPELLMRLHAVARAPMPEPIRDFYVRMAENTAVRQAAMDDYKATFGTMLDVVNRDAARQAGTTDGQAREVMAAAVPAVSQMLGRLALGGDRAAFVRMLRCLAESRTDAGG
jgi:hypothetical protein